jgi:hypothetical protein
MSHNTNFVYNDIIFIWSKSMFWTIQWYNNFWIVLKVIVKAPTSGPVGAPEVLGNNRMNLGAKFQGGISLGQVK